MSDKIEIEIILTKADTKKAFDDVERKGAKAGQETGRKFGNSFSKTLRSGAKDASLSFLKVTAGALALNKAINLLGASFDNLRGFSKGVAEINSILPENQKLTEKATQELIKFSATFGTDQQKQARAFYQIVSSGVKGTANQLRVLATSNRAATAGLVSIDESADVLTTSINAYAKSGLTAKQASDDLFVAVREGKTTFGELSSFLGNVVSVASSAGLEFNELAGFLAFTTKNGLKTDVAVTGLRQVLVSIIKPTKEAKEEARKIGLEFNTAALRAKGLSGFLTDLIKRTGGSEAALSKLFGNVRALTPILQVAGGNFSELNRILKETKNSSGATSKAFAEIAKNTDFRLDQLDSELSSLGLNLLRVVNPAIITFVDGLKFIAKFANKAFTKDTSSLVDQFQASLKGVNQQIKLTKKEIGEVKGFPQKDLFGNISKSGKDLKNLRRSLTELQEHRRDLIKDRATVIDMGKKLDAERVRSEKNANGEIKTSRLELFSTLKELGLKTTESITADGDARLAKLKALRDQELIGEMQFSEGKIQIQTATNAQLDTIEENRLRNSQLSFASMTAAFRLNNKRMKFSAIELAKTMQGTFAKGFGNAFVQVGKAMREGKSEFDAFGNALQAMLANMASALGDFYIAKGIAYSADPITATSGAQMIAAGSGLKILAGLLGSSGGGSSSGGSGGGGSTDTIDDSGILEPQDIERAAPDTNVQLIVQGDVLDSQETGTKLASVLSEAFNKQGVVLTDLRVA